ncbi:MAG: hypothetical protein P4L69_15530 [Desulfosporosinus sp.]|nr:hypothetical protein [Desulfosporosinus sp.]
MTKITDGDYPDQEFAMHLNCQLFSKPSFQAHNVFANQTNRTLRARWRYFIVCMFWAIEFDEQIINALVEKIEILTPAHFVFELKNGMRLEGKY